MRLVLVLFAVGCWTVHPQKHSAHATLLVVPFSGLGCFLKGFNSSLQVTGICLPSVVTFCPLIRVDPLLSGQTICFKFTFPPLHSTHTTCRSEARGIVPIRAKTVVTVMVTITVAKDNNVLKQHRKKVRTAPTLNNLFVVTPTAKAIATATTTGTVTQHLVWQFQNQRLRDFSTSLTPTAPIRCGPSAKEWKYFRSNANRGAPALSKNWTGSLLWSATHCQGAPGFAAKPLPTLARLFES